MANRRQQTRFLFLVRDVIPSASEQLRNLLEQYNGNIILPHHLPDYEFMLFREALPNNLELYSEFLYRTTGPIEESSRNLNALLQRPDLRPANFLQREAAFRNSALRDREQRASQSAAAAQAAATNATAAPRVQDAPTIPGVETSASDIFVTTAFVNTTSNFGCIPAKSSGPSKQPLSFVNSNPSAHGPNIASRNYSISRNTSRAPNSSRRHAPNMLSNDERVNAPSSRRQQSFGLHRSSQVLRRGGILKRGSQLKASLNHGQKRRPVSMGVAEHSTQPQGDMEEHEPTSSESEEVVRPSILSNDGGGNTSNSRRQRVSGLRRPSALLRQRARLSGADPEMPGPSSCLNNRRTSGSLRLARSSVPSQHDTQDDSPIPDSREVERAMFQSLLHQLADSTPRSSTTRPHSPSTDNDGAPSRKKRRRNLGQEAVRGESSTKRPPFNSSTRRARSPSTDDYENAPSRKRRRPNPSQEALETQESEESRVEMSPSSSASPQSITPVGQEQEDDAKSDTSSTTLAHEEDTPRSDGDADNEESGDSKNTDDDLSAEGAEGNDDTKSPEDDPSIEDAEDTHNYDDAWIPRNQYQLRDAAYLYVAPSPAPLDQARSFGSPSPTPLPISQPWMFEPPTRTRFQGPGAFAQTPNHQTRPNPAVPEWPVEPTWNRSRREELIETSAPSNQNRSRLPLPEAFFQLPSLNYNPYIGRVIVEYNPYAKGLLAAIERGGQPPILSQRDFEPLPPLVLPFGYRSDLGAGPSVRERHEVYGENDNNRRRTADEGTDMLFNPPGEDMNEFSWSQSLALAQEEDEEYYFDEYVPSGLNHVHNTSVMPGEDEDDQLHSVQELRQGHTETTQLDTFGHHGLFSPARPANLTEHFLREIPDNVNMRLRQHQLFIDRWRSGADRNETPFTRNEEILDGSEASPADPDPDPDPDPNPGTTPLQDVPGWFIPETRQDLVEGLLSLPDHTFTSRGPAQEVTDPSLMLDPLQIQTSPPQTNNFDTSVPQETVVDSNTETLLPNPTSLYLNDLQVFHEWMEYFPQPNIFRASIELEASAQAALLELQEQVSITPSHNTAEQQPSENFQQTTVSTTVSTTVTTTIQTIQTVQTTTTTTFQPPNFSPARSWSPHSITSPNRY